jgi:MFS family permease
MPTLALLGVVWATALALVPIGATALDGSAALVLFLGAFAVFAIGECLHGTVQAPLVADLADHRVLGRYMALSAFSWGVGFTVGPAVGGFVLKFAPHAWWLAAAAVCLLAGAAALALERALPRAVRRTPRTVRPGASVPLPAEVAEPVA